MRLEYTDIKIELDNPETTKNCSLTPLTENGADCLNFLFERMSFDDDIESWMNEIANKSIDENLSDIPSTEPTFAERANDLITRAFVDQVNEQLKKLERPN